MFPVGFVSLLCIFSRSTYCVVVHILSHKAGLLRGIIKLTILKVSVCSYTQLSSVHMALTSIRLPCWFPCLRVLIPCSLRPWRVKRDQAASWSRAQVIGTNTNM